MQWIGAGTYRSGQFWVRKYAKENPEQLRSYIDGLRQYYRDTKDESERKEIAKVGKLAQAAYFKAFGTEY